MNIFTKDTILNKKIPKQRFYDNLDVSSKIKSKFVSYIDSIVIINKLSEQTIHISKTSNVEEILVFKIILKDDSYINALEELLYIIDRYIPYSVLFCIELEHSIVFKLAYKTRNKVDSNKSIVDMYIARVVSKDELEKFREEISIIYNSLNLEIVYEKLLKILLEKSFDTRNIGDIISEYKELISLRKEIDVLEKKVIKEKQSDKQFMIHKELIDKKKRLQELEE